jgi:hypothetical protein
VLIYPETHLAEQTPLALRALCLLTFNFGWLCDVREWAVKTAQFATEPHTVLSARTH